MVMVSPRNLIVIILAVALTAVLAFYFIGRDERQILRRQRDLVERLSKSGPEKEIGALTRAQEISSFFNDEVVLDLKPYLSGAHGRRDLAGLAYHFRGMVEELSIEMADHKLTIAPDRRTAVLVAVARAKAKYSGEWDQDLREVEMRWAKTEKGWLISSASFTSAIKRPEGL